ncbi:MAG: thiolase family protein [Peptococcaceae bacterium]|jgi:acetyl-CoA C-acetyltransferase|nr:thiolase family protein [Peptococcaceae bacterium]
MSKRDAVIVQAVRTPVGKMRQSLASVSAIDLGAAVVKAAAERAGIDPLLIDDIIFGNLLNYNWGNIAKVIALNADFPLDVTGVTIDRQCSSSLNACAFAAMMIQTGNADVILAGGVESYSQQPFMIGRPETPYPGALEVYPYGSPSIDRVGNPPMIITADNLAKKYNLTREECDEFAYTSHKNAAAAWEAGRFKDQVIDFAVKTRKGTNVVTMDDCVRPDCRVEDLAKLRAIYKDGVTTAGNSSPMNDGASCVLMMSREKAEALGLRILAKFAAFAAAGVDPNIMGIGPVYATRKLFKKTGLSMKDIDLIELNEAFAAQSLACVKELGIDRSITNVNGGAIAIGHPNAASGGILVARLIYEMIRRDVKRGLVSFCIGGGQGFSALIERD